MLTTVLSSPSIQIVEIALGDLRPSREVEGAPAPLAPFRYWAFISYNRCDTRLATKLHRFIESYRIPRALVGRRVNGRPIPRRLTPVFRDRDELPGSGDLGASLRDALRASGALIIICSPHAATSDWVNKEILAYKALGRADHCFPFVVASEPPAAGTPAGAVSPAAYFPRALRFEVAADGTITDRPVEPLAADAREGMDGWENACLKVIAGILGVGFDDLRRREALRQRRRRLVRGALAAAATVLVACGYLALADGDVRVPGGDAIRREIDRHGVTIFRPVMSYEELRALARSVRSPLRRRLLADAASGEIEKEQLISAWLVAQVVGAGFRDVDTPMQDLSRALSLIDLVYASPETDKPDGHQLRETVDDVGNPGRAESPIWTILALSAILERPEPLAPGKREQLIRYLDIAQSIAEDFYPLADGGWNTAARQIEPGKHFIYTTAMALHMLLELRSAHLGWRGDRARLERMTADTAGWLNANFVNDFARSGWRRGLDDDKPPDSGITLLADSALGRACAEADISVPAATRAAALNLMSDLRHRQYEAADPDIRYDVRILDSTGRQRTQVTVTRMIWYGWAVGGVASWRECAHKLQLAPEIGLMLERSLQHLLRDVGPDMVRDVLRPQRPSWVNAETYFGFGNAP